MIETTNEYALFKSIQGNRAIDQRHVERLREAIEHRNLLDKFPVLVNEKMEVIDGQHRLAAAVSLNIPIPYEIAKGLSLADVIQLNTSSKSWGMADYIDSFIELGKKDYQKLKDFKHENALSWSVAIYLLGGERGQHGSSSVHAEVKAGGFIANRPAMGGAAARLLAALNRYSGFNTTSNLVLAVAIVALQKLDTFDEGRLLSKFQTHGLQLQKRVNARYYILELEEIYNFNSRDQVTLYAGQA